MWKSPSRCAAADLRRIDVRQPVVRDDLARHVQDQAAERIALIGVGIDAPVLLVEVLVDRRRDVDERLAVGAQPLVPVAVDDVGAGGVEPAGGGERVLDAILDRLDVGHAAGVAMREHAADRCASSAASAASNSPVAAPARAIADAIFPRSNGARWPSRLITSAGGAGGSDNGRSVDSSLPIRASIGTLPLLAWRARDPRRRRTDHKML